MTTSNAYELRTVDGVLDWAAIEAGACIVNPLRLRGNSTLGVNMFGDDVWNLQPMGTKDGRDLRLWWVPKLLNKGTDGQRPAQKNPFPPHLIPAFKRLTWLLVNVGTTQGTLGAGWAARWRSPGSIDEYVKTWRGFAYDLGASDIDALSAVDDKLLDTYAVRLLNDEARTSASAKVGELGRVAEIAAYAELLPAADRMRTPSWKGEKLHPGTKRGSGNSTEIIHPDTFAPLLWWAQRILACADDIIAAVAWANAANAWEQTPQSSAARLSRVGQIVAERGGVLPHAAGSKEDSVAGAYLARMHGGVQPRDFGHWKREGYGTFTVDATVGQPLPVPTTGMIEGEPWLPVIDYRDVVRLQALLQAAAAVMICTCTGMRGDECLHLPLDALRTVDRPDGAQSYRIDGRIFKTERDDDEQHSLDGREWIWATIKPGADALDVLQRLAAVPGFSQPFALPSNIGGKIGSGPGPKTMTSWIADLIAFANERGTSLGLHRAHHIEEDPVGSVTLDRFRRSVAWHIVNEPQGLIAAGIQFGHMQTTTTDAYSSTKTSGMSATMDQERTEAQHSALEHHARAAAIGDRASGPGAKRLGQVVDNYVGARFRGQYADPTPRELKQLGQDPELRVRQGAGGTHLCVATPTQPESMKCARAKEDEPNLIDCRKSCGNRVYTDETVARVRQEVIDLREGIKEANPLMAARYQKRIDHLEEHIAEHEATAIPLLQIMTLNPSDLSTAMQ